jgi:hypothetical protein
MHIVGMYVVLIITQKGKNVIKRTIEVSGHSLKLYFCMCKITQVKHNSLDCHNFFGISFINYKIYMFKTWHK